MKHIVRKPDFLVKIERPNYNDTLYSGENVVDFGPTENTALINYTFSESLETIDSSFGLSLTAELDENGQSWMDKIQVKDLVFILEFGKCRFIGIVESKRYSVRMGDAPSKTIQINGVALGNLLSSFPLVIDQFLFDLDSIAKKANDSLVAKLTMKMKEETPLSGILNDIYNAFFDLTLKLGLINQQGAGIKTVLDNFTCFNSDTLSTDVKIKYPMALSIYSTGVNNIWDILSNIVRAPVFELFMTLNPDSVKYEAVFRQAPFEAVDWSKLELNEIPLIYITDFDFGISTSEIYTYYLCTVSASGMHDKKAMLFDAQGYGRYAVKDEDKWKKYGYKPLLVDFKYFDASKAESYQTTGSLMLELSEMLMEWYKRNDEYLNGSVSFMTVDSKDMKNPRIGERFSLLDGQFYIENSDHSWSYGGIMETKLALSRGYQYKKSGEPKIPIKRITRKLVEVK